MFKKFSIKVKLTSIITISIVLLVSIITVIVINNSTNALLHSEFNKLKSVRVAKKDEISNYLSYLQGLLTSLASQQGTKDAFLAFEKGFYSLEQELEIDLNTIRKKLQIDFEQNYLNSVNYQVPQSEQRKNITAYIPNDPNALIAQYIFITDNKEQLGKKNNMHYNSKYDSTYMQAHKKFHNSFDTFLNAYELYDIFLVDLKGNLIYTDFKEKDYATNLKNGTYSNTGIAKAYTQALLLNEGGIAFEDFAPYEPSYNSAASFIATPIFIDGIKKGVLIFQMPVDRINAIMQFNGKFIEAGLGESGEVYLVGEDYTMRSNSRFQKSIQDPIVQALGTTIGVWKIDTEATKKALDSISEEKVIKDYRDIDVLSAFDTIDLFGQTKWGIIAEIDEKEALKEAHNLRNIILISSLIIVAIILVFLILFLNNIISKPLQRFEKGLITQIIP